MRIPLSAREAIAIFSSSIILSEISWWVLLSTNKVQSLLHPDIAKSLEAGKAVTINSLPATLVLPIITYLPFWLVTLTLIKIMYNLEKERSRIRI